MMMEIDRLKALQEFEERGMLPRIVTSILVV